MIKRDSKGRFIKGNPSGNNHKAWNKGLKGNDFLKHYKNGHPRGMKGKSPYNKGIPLSEERKEYLSTLNKGKRLSEEHKNNISKGNIGRIVTQETRDKLRIKSTGRKLNEDAIKKIKERRSTQVFPLKDTKIEIKIKGFLDSLNIEYKQHLYIKNIEHSYQCDFYIPSLNLILECYGDYWHKYPLARPIDITRCIELRNAKYKVSVLWEREIKHMTLEDFKNYISKFELVLVQQ
jgi:G:T-mismatch repair DNA endonuclease (very short patch repair protein)